MRSAFIISVAIFVLFGISKNTYGQPQTADSLRKSLKWSNSGDLLPDTANVNILNNLATHYRYTEMDSLLKYVNLASGLSDEIGYPKGFFDAQYLRGWYHFNKGEYQKLLEVSNAGLAHPEISEFPETEALLNQLIGTSYASQGDYHIGLNYFLRALELYRQLEKEVDEFQILNNIGVSYFQLEDYQRALEIFEELDSLRSLSPQTISLPVNLGFINYELGNLDEAERQLMRIINYEGEAFDQRAIGLSTFKLGQIYLQRDQYSLALDNFNRSIEVYDQYDNELEKVQSLTGKALTHLELKNLDLALEFALEANEIATEHNGLPEINESSETLYKVYNERGNSAKALEYLEIFKAYSDSLQNAEVSREVGRLEAEFEYRERELELRELQQQQNLENANKVANRNILILIALSLFIIAVIFAYNQYRNSALREKANKLLRDKNTQIEEQAKRLEEMNDIKTHMFSIIAHDLRGPLSSLHSFITLHEMNQLKEDDIKEMIPLLADKFKYTSTLLNNLLNWARSQLDGYNIEPTTFNIHDQVAENMNVLSYQAKEKNISIVNKTPEDITAYADQNMINLVILNLLSNAIKFTPEKGEIEINATTEGSEIQLCVNDNGIGIKPDKLEVLFEESTFYTTDGTNDEKGTGLGLMLCNDFIGKNNGKIWAESAQGEGSMFCFTLPTEKSDLA